MRDIDSRMRRAAKKRLQDTREQTRWERKHHSWNAPYQNFDTDNEDSESDLEIEGSESFDYRRSRK